MATNKSCPLCGGEINVEAVKCKHCKEFVGEAKGESEPAASQASSAASATTATVAHSPIPPNAGAANAPSPGASLWGTLGRMFKVPAKWNEDIIGWAYVGVLVACSVVTFATGEATWLPLVVVAIMGAVEEKRMRKQGVEWPSNWWALLIPVYLWRRLKALNLPMHLFWIWIAAAVVLTVAEVAFDNAGLENASMGLVTKICHSNGLEGVDCVKVKLGEEFAPDNYRAQAVLSNGNVVDILIQKKGGGMIVRLNN